MTISVEKTGKTVQDAVDAALSELNAGGDEVEVEVLEEGNKGFLGIGGKLAKVRVTLKKSQNNETKVDEFLISVFKAMDIDVSVESEYTEEGININVTGKDCGTIIGRRGETLDSLQYLASLVANKNSDNYVRVTIDVENYRKKREETLVRLANKLASRVVKYRRKITLEPMNPYERRIIHSALQNNRMVETYSVGEEPHRKVVIALRNSRDKRYENREYKNGMKNY